MGKSRPHQRRKIGMPGRVIQPATPHSLVKMGSIGDSNVEDSDGTLASAAQSIEQRSSLSTQDKELMMSSTTDWFNLPFELKFKILDRVGRRDILVNAQNVCTDWYKVFKDPLMWRSINLSRFSLYDDSPPNIAKHAVDRSQGQLVNVVISTFKIIELLRYVADRSSQLRRLEVLFMFGEYVNKALAEALVKFPLLEVLVVSTKYFSSTVIKNAGRYCPSLQKLVVNRTFYVSKSRVRLNNRIAIAIGENLHELRHLKLECNGISNIGLKVVMDGCRHLKSLK